METRTGRPEDEVLPAELPTIVLLQSVDGGRSNALDELGQERHSVGVKKTGVRAKEASAVKRPANAERTFLTVI